jgi:hypothetical protein
MMRQAAVATKKRSSGTPDGAVLELEAQVNVEELVPVARPVH